MENYGTGGYNNPSGCKYGLLLQYELFQVSIFCYRGEYAKSRDIQIPTVQVQKNSWNET